MSAECSLSRGTGVDLTTKQLVSATLLNGLHRPLPPTIGRARLKPPATKRLTHDHPSGFRFPCDPNRHQTFAIDLKSHRSFHQTPFGRESAPDYPGGDACSPLYAGPIDADMTEATTTTRLYNTFCHPYRHGSSLNHLTCYVILTQHLLRIVVIIAIGGSNGV